jgi:hypothetical protein
MENLITQAIYDQSDVQLHQLGALGISKWGSKYRYAKAGASALVAGELLQETVEVTNFRSMVCAESAAIGATSVLVTLGGTAVTANLFAGGTLIVESGTGIGQMFRIVSHDVQTSTTGTCRFYLDRPLKVALVITTSQITVRKNVYNGVIEYPATTQTGAPVGFALQAMTGGYFGWVQTGGEAVVLWDTGTNSANGASAIAPSAAVAGSVAPVLDAVGAITLGYSNEVVSVDQTVGLAHLTMD